MQNLIGQIIQHPWWQHVLWPALIGAAAFFLGLAVRWIVLDRLRRWVEKTRWTWDDLALKVILRPSVLWCLIAGIYAMVLASSVSSDIAQLAGKALTVLWLISLTLVGLKLADELIHRYGSTLATALPLTSLTQNLAKGIILILGLLMILNGLGVSITPILTALGVGGLAVALALQDTLSNLFAGIYILMARQVRVGDYIKLDSGEEGFVADISWRSSRVRSLSNNWIVIPNTKLSQAIVTNFNLPSPEVAVLIEVGVDTRSDLWKVEGVTSEVGKEIMKTVPGGVPEFDPFIRYHTFGDFSVKFTVVLQAKTFVDQYLIKHEFVKRLHRRYIEEVIAIPFPTHSEIHEAPGSVPQPYRS